MASKRAETTVFIERVRAKWVTFDKADYKWDQMGKYGIGVILNEAAATKVNDAIQQVAQQSGENGKRVSVGETLSLNTVASVRDKKTEEILKFKPLVYLPDTSLAGPEDISKIGRNTLFTVKVKVSAYPPIGKPNDQGEYKDGGRAGGVSTKFIACQIVEWDAGEPSAEENGFVAVSPEDEGF